MFEYAVASMVDMIFTGKILDDEFTPLHEAVLCRNLTKTINLMRTLTAADEKNWWKATLSVVECALGWPVGLTTLCNTGYRADLAFEGAIIRNDRTSAEAMMAFDIIIDNQFLHGIATNVRIAGSSEITELHREVMVWAVNSLHTRRVDLRQPWPVEIAAQRPRDSGSG